MHRAQNPILEDLRAGSAPAPAAGLRLGMQSRVAFHEVLSRFTRGDCSYKVRAGVRQDATDATPRNLDDTQMTPEDKLADAAESRDGVPPIRGHRVTSMAGCR